MDIYQYLKNDHKTVSNLFSDIISEKNIEKRRYLFEKLIEEIITHADSEHNTFYRELKKHSESIEEARHGDKEHAAIKKAIEKLADLSHESVEWFVKLGALKQLVEHHVKEEEGSMFKAAKKAFSKETAKNLVQKMEKQKQEMREKSV